VTNTYTPHTTEDRRAMLETIGVGSIEDLLAPVPAALRAKPLDLPPALSESAMLRHLTDLARHNVTTETHVSFLGGGAYHHHIPAAVSALAARGEFVTAYTPYQAEFSQGTLQVIYEWQSLICELTGLDISNASLYDAATGCAEAAAMSVNATGRGTVVVAGSINPDYLAVLRTYLTTQSLTLRVVPTPDGLVEPGALEAALDDDTAVVIAQSPNFYGLIEDQAALVAAAHARGALYVSCVNPLSLALLASPGEVGADIATGDAQPFGVALQYGGPYAGFLSARAALLRRMPGRITGASLDSHGHRAYVLTLQTREQHIKRDKATSNICSNHALCATIATIYLAHQGKAGLRDTATLCVQKAHYAAERIAALPGYSLRFDGPFFHEFVAQCPRPAAEIAQALLDEGILAGVPLDGSGSSGSIVARERHMGDDKNNNADTDLANCLLVCVTEVNSKDDIDRLVAGLAKAAA